LRGLGADLVDIVRDFLRAHRALRGVATRYRSGDLEFETVQALVGDGEASVLFRLKERSHHLFRSLPDEPDLEIGPGVLFDLAVGSLFHEAMKFRENFYQRAAYGPKVRALRSASVPDTSGLLHEFEKILGGTRVRLDESLQEAEILLDQTVGQFRVLLSAHPENGFVTRYLLENAALVEDVIGESIDQLLTDIHGSTGAGHEAAARSYLNSGFFAEAGAALTRAQAHGRQGSEISSLGDFAAGMQAYREGRYDDAVLRVSDWLDAEAEPRAEFVALALAAISRVGQLVERGPSDPLVLAASDLAERMRRTGAREHDASTAR